MQRYTIFFKVVKALHVSGGFFTHHQELKIQNSTHSIWYMPSLLAATSSVGELELIIRNSPTLAVAVSKLGIYQVLCVEF
jgi:hypothetical protein